MKNPLQTFPVSAGLLEPHHVQAIDPSSPWPIYLWCIEHVTRDEWNGKDFDGIVLNGRPVSIQQIAAELGMGARVCRRYLSRLVKKRYIVQKKTGVGACSYIVRNSHRWAWKRQPRTDHNHPSKAPELQPSLFSPDQSESLPRDQKAASGSLDPQAGIRPQGADPQAGFLSDLTKNRPQQKDGSRARSQTTKVSQKTSSSEQERSDLATLPMKRIKTEPSRAAVKLAALLQTEILRNSCDFKITPAQLRSWEETADRMLRLDGRDPEKAATLIRWAHSDDFWMSNILSMEKFRKQFDQLALKANAKKVKPQRSPRSAAGQVIEQFERFAIAGGGRPQ